MNLKKIGRKLSKNIVEGYVDFRRNRSLRGAERRIFIDCGANTCTVLRGFVEKFPEFEFFAFEAQPELAEEGQKVIQENPSTRITFFNKAVWVKNEKLDFYLATKWGCNSQGSPHFLCHSQQEEDRSFVSKWLDRRIKRFDPRTMFSLAS